MLAIRECELRDVVEWIRLNQEFMEEETEGEEIWAEVSDAADTFAKTFAEAMANRDMIRLLIFEEDGVPAGFANLMIIFSVWSHGKAMILDDLYVREDYRGKGFGGQALAYIEKYAAETGCRRLQFQAKRNNVRARGFYESKGYQPAEMCFYMKYL